MSYAPPAAYGHVFRTMIHIQRSSSALHIPRTACHALSCLDTACLGRGGRKDYRSAGRIGSLLFVRCINSLPSPHPPISARLETKLAMNVWQSFTPFPPHVEPLFRPTYYPLSAPENRRRRGNTQHLSMTQWYPSALHTPCTRCVWTCALLGRANCKGCRPAPTSIFPPSHILHSAKKNADSHHLIACSVYGILTLRPFANGVASGK
ncbi:hypothetical protein C8R43DRAFT_963388 [Mycena crocata]|nr:hypothetical protein C8R43DRAFT_963388 [Mycena crocata]